MSADTTAKAYQTQKFEPSDPRVENVRRMGKRLVNFLASRPQPTELLETQRIYSRQDLQKIVEHNYIKFLMNRDYYSSEALDAQFELYKSAWDGDLDLEVLSPYFIATFEINQKINSILDHLNETVARLKIKWLLSRRKHASVLRLDVKRLQVEVLAAIVIQMAIAINLIAKRSSHDALNKSRNFPQFSLTEYIELISFLCNGTNGGKPMDMNGNMPLINELTNYLSTYGILTRERLYELRHLLDTPSVNSYNSSIYEESVEDQNTSESVPKKGSLVVKVQVVKVQDLQRVMADIRASKLDLKPDDWKSKVYDHFKNIASGTELEEYMNINTTLRHRHPINTSRSVPFDLENQRTSTAIPSPPTLPNLNPTPNPTPNPAPSPTAILTPNGKNSILKIPRPFPCTIIITLFTTFITLSIITGTYFNIQGRSMGDAYTLAGYILAIGTLPCSALCAYHYPRCKCWSNGSEKKEDDSMELENLVGNAG